MAEPAKNITPEKEGTLLWDPADLSTSLAALQKYVEGEAVKAIEWYYRAKRYKRWLSRTIQLSAILLTALAGIFPIIVSLLPEDRNLQSGLWSSVFVGVAAALIGLDRAFGFSSGWARYVLVAISIRRAMEEFRMDWTALLAKSATPPGTDDVALLIQRAKEFRVAVEGLVLQETKDWVVEFQSNFAQLEKDVKTQLDTLKTQVEKSEQERAVAGRPGSIELTVADADKTQGFEFQVTLADEAGTAIKRTVANSKTWVHLNLAPGNYSLTVSATAAGRPVSDTRVVVVKPGEIVKPTVTLGL